MSNLQFPALGSVIPAKAGTHGKSQQAFSQRQNTSVATSSIPSHSTHAAAYVGPGLRRDDDCGEVIIENKSGARKQVGIATP
jgi:hypothetical protein